MIRSLADITEQPFAESHGRVSLRKVASIVRHAKRELDITAGLAVLDGVEQLARRRLSSVP